jgi:hypothetical protein
MNSKKNPKPTSLLGYDGKPLLLPDKGKHRRRMHCRQRIRISIFLKKNPSKLSEKFRMLHEQITKKGLPPPVEMNYLNFR